MTHIIKAFFQIFRSNKFLTGCVIAVQILCCVLLLIISTVVTTLNTPVNSIIVGATKVLHFDFCKTEVLSFLNDEMVDNIVVELENGVVASAKQQSVCNLDRTYDFSNDKKVVILDNKFGKEFAVGDFIDLYGEQYRVIDYNSSGFSEIPLGALSDDAEVSYVEFYLNVKGKSRTEFVNTLKEAFPEGFVVEAFPETTVFGVLRHNIVMAFILIVVMLLCFVAMLLCCKYYYEDIKRIGDLCCVLGVRNVKVRAAFFVMLATLSMFVFIIALAVYYIILSLSVSNIQSLFDFEIYRLKAGDVFLNLAIYMIMPVFFSTLYFLPRKKSRKKKNV